MVVIEDPGVALPGAAVVHDDEAPALAQDRGAIDLVADRTGKIVVAFSEQAEGKGKSARLLVAGFLDHDLRGLRWRGGGRGLGGGWAGRRGDGGARRSGLAGGGASARGFLRLSRRCRRLLAHRTRGAGWLFFRLGGWFGFGGLFLFRRRIARRVLVCDAGWRILPGWAVGTVRIFSRDLRKSSFFCSSVSSARVIVPATRTMRRNPAEQERPTHDDSRTDQSAKKRQAGCGSLVVARSVRAAARSLSRRRMAFSFPPRSKRRQVRYIQVSSMMMEARAR